MNGIFILATSLYAIIGGPSVGKTSIIEELKADGKKTIEEAATVVISDNLAKGEKAPWTKTGFQTSIFDLQLKMESEVLKKSSDDHVFIDRGFLDNLVYLEINGMKDSDEYKSLEKKLKEIHASSRYKAVFYIEPFSTDGLTSEKNEIRHEDTEQAIKIANALKNAYSKHYKIVTIPGNLTPKERAKIILENVKKLNTKKV